MKNLLFAVLMCIFLLSCAAKKVAVEQVHTYETIMDGTTKIEKGLLKRSDLDADTSFKWFQQNYHLGSADASAVSAFEKNKDSFQLVVFFGTWCEDSQNLVPAFYRLIDKSGYDEKNITLIGVDRSKATLDNLNKAFHITRVPTFIVMHNGKEVGRVVEYGKSGVMDKELGDVVAGM
jgi:thiol-disulfide isomerase/thioredoxin